MDWLALLWIAAVTSALAGGVASTAAYWTRRRNPTDERAHHRSHILYLLSYILMSISVFFVALRGLIA